MPQTTSHFLTEAEWRDRLERYQAQVREWTHPYRDRKARGLKHPIHDFLFTYYSYSLGRLETWHPSVGVKLDLPPDSSAPKHFTHAFYRRDDEGIVLDPAHFPEARRKSFLWFKTLLENTRDRAPNFACHGLHEWAMVYRGGDVRHRESVPLRLSQEATDRVVETRTIRCTHFDAYRFFAPEAIELNRVKPCMNSREIHEQPACLHANMDLYKWAYKCMPWIGSDLLWECFNLANATRELDMRASPYDLSSFQLTPVKIETREGRQEYEKLQRQLAERSAPIRQKLINAISLVLDLSAK